MDCRVLCFSSRWRVHTSIGLLLLITPFPTEIVQAQPPDPASAADLAIDHSVLLLPPSPLDPALSTTQLRLFASELNVTSTPQTFEPLNRTIAIKLAQIPLQPPVRDSLPPSQQPLQEPLLPSTEPVPAEVLPTPTPSPIAPSQELTPGEVPTTIQVKRFEVIGSTVFSPQDFDRVTATFIDKSLMLSELFQASTAVTQLYVDKGYITSGAYVPPQTILDGVVKIQVIEGTLEAIKITGTTRLQPSYVRNRIVLATTKPLNRNRLIAALELLQLNPLIKTVSANLVAGTRSGQNVLEVKVKEASSFQATAMLDNGRSPSVGTFRRRFQLNEANLLGQGDAITAAYTNTDGSNGLDLNYVYPLNARNGTLSFDYGINFSHVVEPPFNELDINSRSNYAELTVRQPVLQSPRQEFALGLTLSRQSSEATFFNGLIPFFSAGSDDEGRTRIWALRFFQDWTRRSSNQVIALRSQFSLGLDAFDATVNESSPDSRFVAWRGQGQWVRQLAPDTLVLVRSDLQFADRPLVALEQFSLGGIDSVRGYRQDTLLTDNGLLFSAEARLPILRVRRIDSLLQLTPFVDVGTAWNRSGRPDPDPGTLAGIGLGLRWQTRDRLTARLEWGIPLVSIESSKRSWQENGVYFSIVFNPF
jgi:hemolysin activation/secretion protein